MDPCVSSVRAWKHDNGIWRIERTNTDRMIRMIRMMRMMRIREILGFEGVKGFRIGRHKTWGRSTTAAPGFTLSIELSHTPARAHRLPRFYFPQVCAVVFSIGSRSRVAFTLSCSAGVSGR